MSRPVVYIAHPLSGAWAANLASARQWTLWALRNGYAPVAPYLELAGLLDDADPADHALGLEHDLAMIPRCDELWLCGRRMSAGMRAEWETAVRYGIRVRWFSEPGREELVGSAAAVTTLNGWNVRALDAILQERRRQDAKWGVQDHPDGTGRSGARTRADVARARCKANDQDGDNWQDILDEEVCEAFAETDPVLLLRELVQAGAVVVAWIECIDRRGEWPL